MVGTAGLGTRRIRLADGSTATAGLASDFAVDPDHRSLRPALLLARTVAATVGNGVDLIYGLPNSQSAGVFRRIGYELDGTLRRYVKVLRSERFLRPRLPVSAVRRPLTMFADLALRAASPETWGPKGGLTVTAVEEFDSRFDDLWSRASAAQGGAITERTAAFLQWRFRRNPLQRYTVLGFKRPGGNELAGYAVCLIQQKDEQAVVIDILFDPAMADAQGLVAGVVAWARTERAASVACEFEGAPELEAALRGFGFKCRGGKTLRAILVPKERGGPGMLRGWWFLRVDEDYN